MTVDAAGVAAALDRVRDELAAAGGDPDRITVVAVTKGFGADAPVAGLEAGVAQRRCALESPGERLAVREPIGAEHDRRCIGPCCRRTRQRVGDRQPRDSTRHAPPQVIAARISCARSAIDRSAIGVTNGSDAKP